MNAWHASCARWRFAALMQPWLTWELLFSFFKDFAFSPPAFSASPHSHSQTDLGGISTGTMIYSVPLLWDTTASNPIDVRQECFWGERGSQWVREHMDVDEVKSDCSWDHTVLRAVGFHHHTVETLEVKTLEEPTQYAAGSQTQWVSTHKKYTRRQNEPKAVTYSELNGGVMKLHWTHLYCYYIFQSTSLQLKPLKTVLVLIFHSLFLWRVIMGQPHMIRRILAKYLEFLNSSKLSWLKCPISINMSLLFKFYTSLWHVDEQ